jgi:beta-mannosidase
MHAGDTALPLHWELGHADRAEDEPAEWVSATVPGAVQLDWATARNWPDVFHGSNVQAYSWMHEQWWRYRCQIPAVPADGQRLHFCTEGIDYDWQLLLDGEEVYAQEGMFTPACIDLTGRARTGSRLEIRIAPVSMRHQPPERTTVATSCKPACSYGWDWHPSLVPAGPWRDTGLVLRQPLHLQQANVRSQLDVDLVHGSCEVDLRFSQDSEHLLRLHLLDPQGRAVAMRDASIVDQRCQVTLLVERPRLWWPQGHGHQALYTVEVRGAGSEQPLLQRRIGFRHMALRMHEGAWDHPNRFPKSRSNPPISLHVNGRAIFCKGANWVPPDVFPSRVDDTRLLQLVDLARKAHFNTLRIWGGGPINKPAFYEACDQMGILVFQEFPLACHDYPDHPDYLRVLEQEARSIIQQLQHHPSIALWCGGNELFNAWSGMVDQSHALRLLGNLCFQLDRDRPWLPTFPVMGMGHGPYTFRDLETDEEVFATINSSSCTAHSEFGSPGPASVAAIEAMIPKDEHWPPRLNTAWETHHGLNSWRPEAWLCLDIIRHYFGEPENIDSLVANGQLLQSLGFQYIFEESRRQAPRCSMALNWCFNEPWPCVANNSILEWPQTPKPAYYAVQQACRPVLASARLPRFLWRGGEELEAEIWLLNDGPEDLPACTVHAVVEWDGMRSQVLTWPVPELPAGSNRRGPSLRHPLPPNVDGLFRLLLKVPEQPGWSSSYQLLARPRLQTPHGPRALNA